MKRFRFELQSLLDLRKQEQLQAELRQRQLQIALESLQRELRALEDELEAAALQQIESFEGSPKHDAATRTALSPDQLMAMTHFSHRLCNQIQEVSRQEEQAKITLQESAAELARISAAVEGLESLLQTQRAEHLKQAHRRGQQELDEIVLRRWQHRTGPIVEEQSHV